MEVEKFASKGTAGTALGLSIGSLGLQALTGGFGNLLGGWNNGNCNYAVCSDNMPINRYELGQEQKISELQSQIALRDANTYGDQKLLEMYKYVDGKFTAVEKEICDQKVFNATTTATVSCLGGQINCMQHLLDGITRTIVPNSAICPGYGNVSVSLIPATTTTTTAPAAGA